jgi:imidazoleglycerol phosphate dehydratase HisB
MFSSDSLVESIEDGNSTRELRVLSKSPNCSKVFRGTAESHVMVAVDFSKQIKNSFIFNVAPNIDVSNLSRLLVILAEQAGFNIQVEYDSTVLNSSHVVLEDTALVLGRALLEILMLRMSQWGVNGAGSSIQSVDDICSQPIHVGISIEGRKFWLFVPFKDSSEKLKKTFLVGQNIYSNLRSEDLDDFLDGIAGGLACSIIVHVHEIIEADEGWRLIFAGIGKSLKEAFEVNPYRKGVPPGVKATLA